jgi:hypothetical protein
MLNFSALTVCSRRASINYCGKPFKEKEKTQMASKWCDDHPGIPWVGAIEYPNGLAHIACDKRYKKNDCGRAAVEKRTATTHKHLLYWWRRRESNPMLPSGFGGFNSPR